MDGSQHATGRSPKPSVALVKHIVNDQGTPPFEAIELQLCEIFHCRPSELEDEDASKCLRMMDLKRWRDAALLYKEGGESLKRMDFHDRVRIHQLCEEGQEDALTRPHDDDDIPEHRRQSASLVEQGLIEKKK